MRLIKVVLQLCQRSHRQWRYDLCFMSQEFLVLLELLYYYWVCDKACANDVVIFAADKLSIPSVAYSLIGFRHTHTGASWLGTQCSGLSIFCTNSLRHCRCKPTAHCNTSRNLVGSLLCRKLRPALQQLSTGQCRLSVRTVVAVIIRHHHTLITPPLQRSSSVPSHLHVS